MVIYIDIDKTICNSPDAPNYVTSTPIIENIEKANTWYDKGHLIVYWTARGTGTGIDWSELTKKQLDKWGVKYHSLKFGKPNYDLFIDDKNINTKDWNSINLNDYEK